MSCLQLGGLAEKKHTQEAREPFEKVQTHMLALVYSYTVHNAESHTDAYSACVE